MSAAADGDGMSVDACMAVFVSARRSSVHACRNLNSSEPLSIPGLASL